MLLLLLGFDCAHAEDVIKGCACKGELAGPQGTCGYHFNWDHGKWDKPWCRCTSACKGEKDKDGAYMYCNKAYVEKHRADDGKLYDAKEFRDYYGKDSEKRWIALSDEVERRMAGDYSYNVNDFRDWFLGSKGGDWVSAWAAAKPEQRQVKGDTKWYTFDQFVEYYGTSNALTKWRESKKAKFADLVKGCACLGYHGGDTGVCGYHYNWVSGNWAKGPWCRCATDCKKETDSKGMWMYCNTAFVEKRMANDGKLYSAFNFRDYFGKTPKGESEWEAQYADVERRMVDNKAYTVNQFRDWYITEKGENWPQAWTAAKPEQRQYHKDPTWYTFDEYVKFYGLRDAWWYWNESKKAFKSHDEL
jgi:hypothetical protein